MTRDPIAARFLAVVVLTLSLVACTKAKDTPVRPDDSGSTRAAPPAAAPPADAAPAPTPDPACATTLGDLAGRVTDARVTADPLPALKRARAAWIGVPAGCRGAGWYLAAAHLLRLDEPTLEVDGIRLATPREALAAGLALPGADAELLVFVAYLAAVDPAAGPPLPAAACAEVARAPALPGPDYVTADARHYVCGLAALRDRDAAAAARELGAIEDPKRFADVDLRLADAAAASGDRRTARAAARRAAELSENRGLAFGATPAEIATIRAAGKALLSAR